jgi:hypothetical protein
MLSILTPREEEQYITVRALINDIYESSPVEWWEFRKLT